MEKNFSIFVGFDGFIDHILLAIDRRFGPGNHFQKIEKIQQFAERIANASGKSTNIELFPIERRIGGNGPILAQTLAFYGVDIALLGALGQPIDPIFQDLSPKIHPISIGQPGITHAIEFEDGKLLLGITHALDNITPQNIAEPIQKNAKNIFACDAFCLTNWTMIIHMNEILDFFWEKLETDRRKIAFFDLADPEKRSPEDILSLIPRLRRYAQKCFTILGLNLKEAEQIARLLRYRFPQSRSTESLRELCASIQNRTSIDEVFIHDAARCTAANNAETAFVEGFFVEHPKTITGAGDHFNAGYLLAKLQKKSLQNCLLQAHKISGHFVATGNCLSL
ncbi:MAG: carbohydrate kinase family protein [Puniceicoccales bacterium]|jgi:sugar/nucleoside kinase (ribokinase family)|nr:carbohydrate kinase family protein [Puniceicoccales bacterium]